MSACGLPGHPHTRAVNVMFEARLARGEQIDQYGNQRHPDGTGDQGWRSKANHARAVYAVHAEVDPDSVPWRLLMEEQVYDAFASEDTYQLRKELLATITVASAWVEDLDRRREEAKSKG